MELEQEPRRLLPRLVTGAAASAVAGGAAAANGMRPLDVALWCILAPLAALTVLELAPRARRSVAAATHPTPVVVLPERSVAQSAAPDPAVQARAAVVERARSLLLEARQRGEGLDVLLALSEALHEANLDLARATLTAGGMVPPALRDELALRGQMVEDLRSSSDQPRTSQEN